MLWYFIVIWSISAFFLSRCFTALYWNNILCDRSIKELDGYKTFEELQKLVRWYQKANVFFWVLNPISWWMWTPNQYEKYLKSHK